MRRVVPAGARTAIIEGMDDVVRKLADVEVLTPEGGAVRLGTTWEDRSILLAIIRHFG